MLTFYEFAAINNRLRGISDTWSDLWVCLYYLPVGVGRIIRLPYSGLSVDSLTFERRGRLREIKMLAPPPVRRIMRRRREAYPEDIYVFQSHSNRVKAKKKPVTVIAFNQALKKASVGVTNNIVTSKSILYTYTKSAAVISKKKTATR